MQDGLISILGLVAGVYGAYPDDGIVVATIGITGAIAAAISMAVGSLLSSEAERDLLLAEIKQAYELFKKNPYLAQESLLEELVASGLPKPEAYRIIKLLSTKEDALFQSFQNNVLELPDVESENPYVNALVMFFAFIVGSAFPVLPFVVLSGLFAFQVAVGIASTALFSLGYLKGYFAKESPLKSGLKFFFIAILAGVLSEWIGTFVSSFYT